MTHFRTKPGSGSVTRRLKRPFPDILAFAAVIRELCLKNPLGCTSYNTVKRTYPPVRPVRERYTLKFVYRAGNNKQVGSSSEVYDSVERYETGIASMITNLANIASHRGKIVHLRDADLFSVTLKCHDRSGEFYFLSLARNRITVSSFTATAIVKKVQPWADSVPGLA